MGKRASILIVDDNISLSRTLSFVLERKGYAATTDKDGPEAIERIKEEPFDLIFLDIKLPFMNGVEAYRRIKKIRPESVVVMMTAYAVEDMVQEALQEGACGIIYKPLDMGKVIARIERAREAMPGALILVVDNDPGTVTLLKNMLTRRGCRVGIAHTGKEAIAMTQEKTYEIIFIEMKLPLLNGLETYLAIKKINPETVAIMMTAYPLEMAELVEQALKSYAYAYLDKPLKMEVLHRLVDEILEKKKEVR